MADLYLTSPYCPPNDSTSLALIDVLSAGLKAIPPKHSPGKGLRELQQAGTIPSANILLLKLSTENCAGSSRKSLGFTDNIPVHLHCLMIGNDVYCLLIKTCVRSGRKNRTGKSWQNLLELWKISAWFHPGNTFGVMYLASETGDWLIHGCKNRGRAKETVFPPESFFSRRCTQIFADGEAPSVNPLLI